MRYLTYQRQHSIIVLIISLSIVSSFAPSQHALLSLGPRIREPKTCTRWPDRTCASLISPYRALRQAVTFSDSSGVQDTSHDAVMLQAFLAREGFEYERLRLAYFGDLRGMMAIEDISPGDCLFAFPAASATFNLAMTRKCPCPELVDAVFWQESESWVLKMALWLVAEELKGSTSRFFGYIKTLPRVSGSLLTWQSSQLAQLNYAPLETQVLKTRAQMRQAIVRSLPHLKCSPETAAELTAPGGSLEWAWDMSLSRTFTFQWVATSLNKVLVPGLCMINHDSRPEFHTTFQYDRTAGTDGMMRILSQRSYHVGEQVFLAYGDKSNDSLLQNYGFSQEGNIFDNFRLFSLLTWLQQYELGGEHDGTHEEGLARVKEFGLLKGLTNGQVDLALPAPLRISPETLWALRAYVTKPAAIFAALDRKIDALASQENTTDEPLELNAQDVFKEALHFQSEELMLRLLLAHLRDLQRDMGGVGDKTEEEERVGDVGSHAAATAFRKAKMLVLATVCAEIEGGLAAGAQ